MHSDEKEEDESRTNREQVRSLRVASNQYLFICISIASLSLLQMDEMNGIRIISDTGIGLTRDQK